MPQLVPYFFVNQASFALLALLIIVYAISAYILPAFVELFISRVYITRL